MTDAIEVLRDGYGRVAELVRGVLDGLGAEQLETQLEPGTNTIGWLVWHLSRVQDDHVADAAGREQVWTAGGWHEQLGLPFLPDAIGYGFSVEQMAQVRGVTAQQLAGYHDAVHAATLDYLATLGEDDLDRVVDEQWDPPVTLSVRLVSVLSDDLQHAGQAALVRGVLERR